MGLNILPSFNLCYHVLRVLYILDGSPLSDTPLATVFNSLYLVFHSLVFHFIAMIFEILNLDEVQFINWADFIDFFPSIMGHSLMLLCTPGDIFIGC